jgi:WD40 repeat protein/3',5'-cyclic AMP phosphodiesterase CpdA
MRSAGSLPRRVFLSHTSDLRRLPTGDSFVDAAEDTVMRAGHAVTDMAYFSARETSPADTCIDEVTKAQVYVGIIGLRYGATVRGRPELSYTELEFETATRLELPRLIFLVAEDALPAPDQPPDLVERQEAFRLRLREETGLTVTWVRSPNDLRIALQGALHELGERTRDWSITLLHLSDLRFGERPGGDSPYDRLPADLDGLRQTRGLTPEVVVVSGDLTAHGLPSELERAERFLGDLARRLGLDRRRVVLVPGDRDIARRACEAYFLDCAGKETDPQPPYWPKWTLFAAMVERFYGDDRSIRFDLDRPYTLAHLPELRLAVACLNSTMAESHRPEDHYGELGEDQLGWFAEQLQELDERSGVRVGVVHHDVLAGGRADDVLRDAGDLERILAPHLDLLLHGRPSDAPDEYRVLRIEPDRIRRWARRHEIGGDRWTSAGDGDPERSTPTILPGLVTGARARPPRQTRHDDFLDRVLAVTKLRVPGADVQRFGDPPREYLRVSATAEGMARVYPVGGCEGDAGDAEAAAFADAVLDRYRSIDPLITAELVYGGAPAAADVVERARRRGVRLTSFLEYQGVLDLRDYRRRLLDQLLADPVYPPRLYVPQRYSLLEGGDGAVREDLLGAAVRWLDAPGARFVLVLGDFGAGKTFFLHELARRIPEELPDVVPLLIELRTLQKARTLDELIALHLAAAGEERFDMKAFRFMLREGRLALLFDGFDELAYRLPYEQAADHFSTLLQAAEGQARVVVTSRTQHFMNDAQVSTALGARVEQMSGRRLVRLEPLADEQILAFLERWFDGDRDRAERRFAQLGRSRVLLELAHNSRLLAFIAELDEEHISGAARERPSITQAELYRVLLTRWLEHEVDRAQPRGGESSLSIEERWEAVTALAVALWQRPDRALALSDLTATTARAMDRMARHGLDAGQAAQAVGSGTLLVRDEEGAFGFVHPSVMEWLVARAAARLVGAGQDVPLLAGREMSPLMADFLRDLSEPARAGAWARGVLSDRDTGDAAKRNALLVLTRLGEDWSETVQFTGCDLRGADLSGQDLARADIRGADLTDATLVGARLAGANLAGATAHRARLDEADLRGADLTDADLTGARLLGADLRGATLDRCVLRRAALIGARLDPRTPLPADVFGAALPAADLPAITLQVQPNGATEALAFSPDGALLATASGRDVVVIDVASGLPLRRVDGHTGPVRAVAFGPDGEVVASAGDDGGVRLWDVASGREARRFEAHIGPVRSVAFSPDGRLLTSAGDDGTVRVWDVSSGRETRRFERHVDWVRSAAFSPDGALVASAGDDGSVRLWDVASGQETRSIEPHAGPVRSVAFGPDGRLLAFAGDDGCIRIRELPSGQEGRDVRGPAGPMNVVAFSRDGGLLASAGDDGCVRLWEPASGREARRMDGHAGAVRSVAFDADGRLLASAGDDGTVRVWDVASGHELRRMDGRSDRVRSVAFSPDGRLLASACDRGSLRLWETVSGRSIQRLEGHSGPVRTLAFTPDGQVLAAADGSIRLWRVGTGKVIHRFDGHTGPVRALAFSPDGRLLASAGDDRSVRLWAEDGGASRLDGHAGWVWSVAFSPDGRLLASASDDGTVRLWGVGSEREVRRMEGHAGWVRALAFSPNGRLLASASDDATVRLWEVATGQEVRSIPGDGDQLGSVAFSPDGRLLVRGGNDGSVALRDVASGRQVRRIVGQADRVRSLALSRDGRLLASAGDDRSIRLWSAATGHLLSTLVALADGWACLLPDGPYRLEGTPAGELWYAAGLCRFQPGELDPYVRALKRLDPASASV